MSKLKSPGQMFFNLIKTLLLVCGLFAVVIAFLYAVIKPSTSSNLVKIDPPQITDSVE